MFCSTCGKQVDDSVEVCPCGADVQPQTMTMAASAGVGAAPNFSSTGTVSAQTKACPMCGEQILATAIRCKHCQASLTQASFPQGITLQGSQVPTNQPSIIIQNVQSSQAPPQWAYREIKNPGLAVLFSFIFPGGGQFYNGHAGKGILVLLTFWIFGITYIWSLFDAHNSAKRINRTGA